MTSQSDHKPAKQDTRTENAMNASHSTNGLTRRMRLIWRSPRIKQARSTVNTWRALPYSGPVALVLGTLLATLFIMAFDRSVVTPLNPGLIYLPVPAMLAYPWQWLLALAAGIIQLFCVYFFFITPFHTFTPRDRTSTVRLIVLAAAMGFGLAIVHLAVLGRN